MKKLRDIIEQERSPERAKKLIRYMGKKERFKKGVDSLWKRKGDINSLFPFEDKKFYSRKLPTYGSHWEKLPEVEVPVHKIKTIQQSIGPKDVAKKISGDEKNSSSLPYMVHHVKSDTYYIWDGNHRTAAARLLKKPTVRAKVYSYDGD